MKFKSSGFYCIALAGFITVLAVPCNAKTYYVSPTGNDSNPGTQAQPFHTIERARDGVRRLAPAPDEDITVYLRGGTYHIAKPIRFTPADSGQSGRIVYYRNVSGEVPILDGGAIIRDWKIHDPARGIWMASVPAGSSFRQLYVNGVKATMARSANALGLKRIASGFASVNPGLLSLASSRSMADMELLVRPNPWTWDILPVGGISKDGVVTIQGPCWDVLKYQAAAGHPHFGNPEYIQNAYEFLSKPGDWCLQHSSHTLYYIPRAGEDMTNALVEAPLVEQLMVLSGSAEQPVSNLRFEGITFQMTTWLFAAPGYGLPQVQANQPETNPANWVMKAAFDGSWMRNVDVSRCAFSRLGGNGVNVLKGSKNVAVDHCLFHAISGSAIQCALGWKPDATVAADSPEIVEGIIVSNNTVYDVCTDCYSGCGIYFGYTRNSTITHNALYNLPYTGISLGWGWGQPCKFASGNFIEGNLIHDHMRLLADGGAIYCNGNQKNATMADNYAYHQGSVFGVLYLDDGSSNWSVFNNVACKGSSMWWILYKASNNHCYGNFSDDPKVGARNIGPVPSTCAGNTTVTDGHWPPAAVAIMKTAGPEADIYYTSRPQSILINEKGSDSFQDLKYDFNAVAGHRYALSYSQASLGGSNNQTVAVSVMEGNVNMNSLGASTTWVPDLYARFIRTFVAAGTGKETVRLTNATPVNHPGCALDRIELRDVTPPGL